VPSAFSFVAVTMIQTPEQKKQRKREYDRCRYEQRRDEKLAQNRRWREANPEKQREIDRNYYEANRDRVIERSITRQQDHADERREYMAAYKESHRERLLENARQYRAANLEAIREKERLRSRDPERRRRHYLTQQVPRRTADKSVRVKTKEWTAILDAAGRKCLHCGASENLQMDHIIPVTKGGLTSVDNVQPLCKPCNQHKGTKRIDYRTPQVLEAIERLDGDAR
jgi:5-methylcytosine-specific restriction endonuclease McrA